MYADSGILENWEKQFSKRRVWLLLDGLDEMTPETRDALSLKGWISQTRVIVTCRLNVWQSNPRIISGFETYRMLEFRLPQIEEFTQKWFTHDEAAWQQLYKALNQLGKERIRDLVRNPLRLTLLCSTWQSRERNLPDTRADLYEQFVEDLYEWKKERFPTSNQQRVELNQKLGELSREAIDKEPTRFRLRHDLVCRIFGDLNEPDSLLKLALDLGWLNAIGRDPQNPREPVYAFFHATFQEYFAAQNIDSWDFFMPPEHEDKPVENPTDSGEVQPYRIFEPQWKEVILLWLGRKNIEDTSKYEFIDSLRNFSDGCRGFYANRALFLATLGALELPKYPDSRELVKSVVTLACGQLDPKTKKWITYLEPLEKQARITLLSAASHLIIEELVNALESAERSSARYEIANLISKIELNNRKASEALGELLESDQGDWLKLQVASSLIQMSPSSRESEKALIKIAKSAEYEWIKRDAAWELLRSQPGHLVGVDALIQILCTSQDESMLLSLNLDEIGLTHPKLLRILLRICYSGKTPEVRSISGAYLVRLFFLSQHNIEGFLGFAKIMKSFNELFLVVEEKPNSGISCIKYVANLVDEICTSSSSKNRKQACWKLVGFAIDHPDITRLILKLAFDQGGQETTKSNLSDLLERLDVDMSLVVSIWMDLVANLKDRQWRTGLALAMVRSGFEDNRINSVLVRLLNDADPTDKHVRYALAEGLLENDSTNSQAIDTFFDLLVHNDDWNVCHWVANSLAKACNDNFQITHKLLDTLLESGEERVLESVGTSFSEVFSLDSLKITTERLKCNLGEETRQHKFPQYQSSFEILFHAASRLPYRTFYHLWNE